MQALGRQSQRSIRTSVGGSPHRDRLLRSFEASFMESRGRGGHLEGVGSWVNKAHHPCATIRVSLRFWQKGGRSRTASPFVSWNGSGRRQFLSGTPNGPPQKAKRKGRGRGRRPPGKREKENLGEKKNVLLSGGKNGHVVRFHLPVLSRPSVIGQWAVIPMYLHSEKAEQVLARSFAG